MGIPVKCGLESSLPDLLYSWRILTEFQPLAMHMRAYSCCASAVHPANSVIESETSQELISQVAPLICELMNRRLSVIFQAPYKIVVEESTLPIPGPGEVLIAAKLSAISPGTEMLFYRGQIPEGTAVDDTIQALSGDVAYPLAYGYALVGDVTAVGPQVDDAWLGRTVFVFAPHQSHVISRAEDLLIVPEDLPAEDAVLLPFMETAVSFLMDGQPMIGEQVVVFGQGIIGLLVTTLLSRFPLAGLVSVDPIALRRDWSVRSGATQALDPDARDFDQQLALANQGGADYRGADLVFELSGSPQVLDQAIACTGFDGRVLVGSWYGSKRSAVDLGGHFHRNQISFVSSQVSHIAPRWRGRFDKARRLQMAWAMLNRHRPSALITHRFPAAQAAEAYRTLDQSPETAVQLILEY